MTFFAKPPEVATAEEERERERAHFSGLMMTRRGSVRPPFPLLAPKKSAP